MYADGSEQEEKRDEFEHVQYAIQIRKKMFFFLLFYFSMISEFAKKKNKTIDTSVQSFNLLWRTNSVRHHDEFSSCICIIVIMYSINWCLRLNADVNS